MLSYRYRPTAWMGMLRFVPFSMFLQKVRKMRAGMKPPPPMAMKRSGAGHQLILSIQRLVRVRMSRIIPLATWPRAGGIAKLTKLLLNLWGGSRDGIMDVVVTQTQPRHVRI